MQKVTPFCLVTDKSLLCCLLSLPSLLPLPSLPLSFPFPFVLTLVGLVPHAGCVLPSDSGPCEAHMEMYFYNATTGRCEMFVYGGCQGNDNRFSTMELCQQACRKLLQTWLACIPRYALCVVGCFLHNHSMHVTYLICSGLYRPCCHSNMHVAGTSKASGYALKQYACTYTQPSLQAVTTSNAALCMCP